MVRDPFTREVALSELLESLDLGVRKIELRR